MFDRFQYRPRRGPLPPTGDPDQGRHEQSPYIPGTSKPIQNEDGSVSTERSITVTDPDLNEGRPTNIPTIWNGEAVSHDEAINRAIKSGLSFPSFRSIAEAEEDAALRSNAIGEGRIRSVGGASLPYDSRPYDEGRHELLPGDDPDTEPDMDQDDGQDTRPAPLPADFPFDYRRPGQRPYETTDREGLDTSNDAITGMPWPLQAPTPGEPSHISVGDTPVDPAQRTPSQIYKRYTPPDNDPDGIQADINDWHQDQLKSPEDREQEWIEQNLFPKGLTADKKTREIVDPQGNVVGRLPDF